MYILYNYYSNSGQLRFLENLANLNPPTNATMAPGIPINVNPIVPNKPAIPNLIFSSLVLVFVNEAAWSYLLASTV